MVHDPNHFSPNIPPQVVKKIICIMLLHIILSNPFKMHYSSVLLFHHVYLLSLNPLSSSLHILIQWLKSLTSTFVTRRPPSFSSSIIITLKFTPTNHENWLEFDKSYVEYRSYNLSSYVHLASIKVIINSYPNSWLCNLNVSICSSSYIITNSITSSMKAQIFPFKLTTACCRPSFLLYTFNSYLSWNGSIKPTKQNRHFLCILTCIVNIFGCFWPNIPYYLFHWGLMFLIFAVLLVVLTKPEQKHSPLLHLFVLLGVVLLNSINLLRR